MPGIVVIYKNGSFEGNLLLDKMIYKLTNQFYIKPFWVLVFFCTTQTATAQDTILNKYGLRVISELAVYKKSIGSNDSMAMVNIKKMIPNIEMSLRYATANNFIHKKLYPPTTTTYLRNKAATALAAVQKELNTQGLGLKIFDAYRPYAATELMWELVKDNRYAADPKKGSGHNRGIAVDLTIIHLKTKKELDMGTGFDNFSDTAHHDFMNLSKEVLLNRMLLKTLMEKNGFKALDTEWWHYALPNGKEYALLNIGFKVLKKTLQ